MNILITGSTGFLGKKLVSLFAQKDYNVYELLRNNESLKKISHNYATEKVILEGSWEKILDKEFDFIFHAATEYNRDGNSTHKVIEANYSLPLRILERVKSPKTVFVYFDSFFNIENVKSNYLPDYCLTKKHFIEMAEVLSTNRKIVILKLFHIYGEGDSKSKFIPWLIQEVLSKKSEIKLSSGLQKRDFIYIDDVVRLVEKLISNPEKIEIGSLKLQVGTSVLHSIKELTQIVFNEATIIDPYIKDNVKLMYGEEVEKGDKNLEYPAEISKTSEMFGWTPEVSLNDGILRTIKSFL
ncbi:MAG: NAD(P)-dependent oxidoreductase [Leptospiraceae bacterium]|nr:NAD(P)-dependent oxidoreductase [Leptospiraceae bacterium]